MAAAAVGSFRAGLKRGCQYLVGKSPSFTPIRQMGTLVTSRGSRHVRTPPHLKMSCLTTCGNVGVRWLCSDSTPRVKKVQGRKKWVGSVAMVGKGRIFHVAYPILKVMGLDPHVFTQVPDRQDVRQHKMRGDESVEELEVLLKPYDAVLNLACQYNGETWKPARREEIYDTNTELASRIAEAASQQDKPCILMSSRASKYPGIDSVHHPYA